MIILHRSSCFLFFICCTVEMDSIKNSLPSDPTMHSQHNRLPYQKATVETLAASTPSTNLPHARIQVVERIKKCLARAYHANANESEAKSAMKMAQKIMEQHSISQAQVMEGENDAQRLQRGGLSTVNIGPRMQGGRVIFQTWVADLSKAICTFFECKKFSSQSFSSIKWTYYGVAEHTASAAMAFEMTHNLIQEWARPLHGVSARNSYCLGVAHGLRDIAKAERRAAEHAAKENEAKPTVTTTTSSSTPCPSVVTSDGVEDSARFGDSDGISGPSIAPVEEYMDTDQGGYESEGFTDEDSTLVDFKDEDSDMPDVSAPFEAELKKLTEAQSGLSKDRITSEEPGKVEWASSMQLTIYRENVAKIAEAVLEANNVRLHAGKKRNRSVKDKEQYAQGVKDSRDINVRGGRIENGQV